MSAWYWPENHRCCLLNLIMISFLQGRRRKSQLRGGNKRHVIWNGKYWNELGIVYTVCLCVHVQSMYMCYRIRSALIYWCRHSHITTRKMQVIISSYPFIQFLFDRARGCIRLQLGQLSIDVQLPFESHLGIIRTAEDQKTITWWVADDGDALAVSEFLRDVWYLVLQWCLAIFRTLKMANLWHTMIHHGNPWDGPLQFLSHKASASVLRSVLGAEESNLLQRPLGCTGEAVNGHVALWSDDNSAWNCENVPTLTQFVYLLPGIRSIPSLENCWCSLGNARCLYSLHIRANLSSAIVMNLTMPNQEGLASIQ